MFVIVVTESISYRFVDMYVNHHHIKFDISVPNDLLTTFFELKIIQTT
jgi:hypothetical protein